VTGVSDRHSGQLDGKLTSFDAHLPVSVTVVIADAVADRMEAQHSAWMLLNRLFTIQGVVGV